MVSTFQNIFSPYILQNIYDVPGNKVAGTIAETATIPIVIMIISELAIGSIYDIYGRKKPLIFTYFAASLGLLITPFFKSVYPWY